MKTKVNFRVNNQGEVIAVFLPKVNNKFMCYSLYDGIHFDADINYIKDYTIPAKGYNISELCAYLENREYKPEVILKISYK